MIDTSPEKTSINSAPIRKKRPIATASAGIRIKVEQPKRTTAPKPATTNNTIGTQYKVQVVAVNYHNFMDVLIHGEKKVNYSKATAYIAFFVRKKSMQTNDGAHIQH